MSNPTAEALADLRAYIVDRTGPAVVDARPLPGHPDCTAYEITGATWGSVQRAIDGISEAPGVEEATFRKPRRVHVPDLRWQSRGFSRQRVA